MRVFLLICTCFFSSNLNASSQLSNWPFTSGETLHYKLSYQGLLTSFVWADLADVKLSFVADTQLADTLSNKNKTGHKFIVNINTEHYLKAELIQPVRYSYTATTDTVLEKILLVEKIDLGKANRHEFLWLDWQAKETYLFEVNESVSPAQNQKIPKYFNSIQLSDSQRTQLVYKESGDKISHENILDPLSLIYYLRTRDNIEESEKFIAVSDDIRKYKIKFMGKETLKLNDQKYQSKKYKIQTHENKDKFYYVWLTDDKKKIPLRFAMDAPLGQLNINLVDIK
ncbi:MAG: DUF3108 domain-containing protein [Proteobacteria bacterium]|nr:DUF3108 domain-containing protein [Pseudomonadota bacterium]